MRSRRIKKQIWLNDEEEYIMKCKSQAVGMNASDYIRHLIVGYKPKEKPSEQFYEEIKNIRNIGNNINQIARITNAKGVIDVPHLKKEIDKLDELIIDMKNKYLRSDKVVEAKLCEWLNQDEKNFDDLFSLVKFIKPKEKKVDDRKYTFCITGEFVGKRRTKAIEEIENECPKWKFVSGVTKETDILIKGQEGGMSNKEISAVKYKIPILVLDGPYDINKIKEKIKEME